MTNIKKNLEEINKNLKSIDLANKVTLVAVSKQQSIDKIIQAIHVGQKIFGENYLQEAIKKIELLKEHKLEWHFIGPIQSNKCKLIAENFSWVHTVDRLKIARRINEARENMPPINICIQINISQEDTKSGLLLDDLDNFADELKTYDNLKIRGLMAIPSNSLSDEKLTIEFNLLRDKYEVMKKKYLSMDTLSMGMSNDYLLAIKNGSNLVRIGSKIFGKRT
jgi:pyridoxal phosphate enzyme (YggS family)